MPRINLVLYKTLGETSGYGDWPNFPDDWNDPRVECWSLDIDEAEETLLEENLVKPVDKLCDACLDFDEADFFNAAKCGQIKAWAEGEMRSELPGVLAAVLPKLRDFAARAVELGTGIVIEL